MCRCTTRRLLPRKMLSGKEYWGPATIERDERAVSRPEKAVRCCVRISIGSGDGILGVYAHRGGAIGKAGKARGAGTSKRGKGSRSHASTCWAKKGRQQATGTKQITAAVAMDTCVPPCRN